MTNCPPLCLILTSLGVLVAMGGMVSLITLMRDGDAGSETRRPLPAFATVAVGAVIAYRTYSSFDTLDAQDITIMFLFVFALISLLALQFFILNRNSRSAETGKGAGEQKEV